MSARTVPAPLVKLKRHPLKWTRNTAVTVVLAIVLAHVGFLAVAGLYYVVLELWPPITNLWHEFSKAIAPAGVNPNYLRHMIRDVGEGFLGGFLAQQVIWNHYKRGHEYEHQLSPGKLALRLPAAVLFAIPGFVVALLLVKGFHHEVTSINRWLAESGHAAKGDLWERTTNALWSGNVDKKVIGLGASLFFGRRPMRHVFDEVQLFFAQRRFALGKPVSFYHPPTFRARYNDIKAHGATGSVQHQAALNRLMMGGVVLLLGFAGAGYYVVTYVA